MHLNAVKSTFVVAFSLAASLVNANPMPLGGLKKRITCTRPNGYIPACCAFVTYTIYPNLEPGWSPGCKYRYRTQLAGFLIGV